MSNTFRHLVGLILPLWRWVLASITFGVLTIGSSIALMGVSAWLIARAALHPSVAVLGIAIVGVRAFGIGRGVFRYMERLTSHEVTFRLLRDLRVWFYQAIEPLAPARLSEHRSGDLLTRVLGDIQTLENFYIRAIAPPLVAVVIGLGMAVFLWILHPLLVPIALMAFALMGLGVPWLAWRLSRRAGEAVVAARADLNTTLLDVIQGLPDVLVFGQEAMYLEQVQTQRQTYQRAQTQLAIHNGLQMAANSLIASLTVVALLVVGIPRIDPILLAPLALAVTASFEAFLPLAAAFQQMGATIAAGQRLLSLLVERPLEVPPSTAPFPTTPSIEFERVTFAYTPSGRAVLKDFSLQIEAGEAVMVVGPSGIGKTTLVSLLLGFWEPQGGIIRIGGEPITHYEGEDLRRMIGVVSQQTHIFNATIRENLRLARPSADDTMLQVAAQHAQLHEFIMSLPNGYDTWVGEYGYKLSGGERQRLAIARVLLKDAPILILDEPTAHLDPANTQAVLAGIQQAMQGRTTLVITHDMAGYPMARVVELPT
ncbi:MAG: thiol reductant ABC exporter subunit CydC [Anaerolineales bacterium]|nr:thiol reductant ABC exporter subunit CydC [Anaerolineales bacterium]